MEQSKAVVGFGGFNAEVTKEDSWETVGMIVVLVLGIYLGVKLINKFLE